MHQVQTKAKTTSLPGALSTEAIAVRGALLERGLETPMIANPLSRDQRYARIRDSFTVVMETLGLDLTDDSLEETPHRIAKMYVDELFSGLDYVIHIVNVNLHFVVGVDPGFMALIQSS